MQTNPIIAALAPFLASETGTAPATGDAFAGLLAHDGPPSVTHNVAAAGSIDPAPKGEPAVDPSIEPLPTLPSALLAPAPNVTLANAASIDPSEPITVTDGAEPSAEPGRPPAIPADARASAVPDSPTFGAPQPHTDPRDAGVPAGDARLAGDDPAAAAPARVSAPADVSPPSNSSQTPLHDAAAPSPRVAAAAPARDAIVTAPGDSTVAPSDDRIASAPATVAPGADAAPLPPVVQAAAAVASAPAAEPVAAPRPQQPTDRVVRARPAASSTAAEAMDATGPRETAPPRAEAAAASLDRLDGIDAVSNPSPEAPTMTTRNAQAADAAEMMVSAPTEPAAGRAEAAASALLDRLAEPASSQPEVDASLSVDEGPTIEAEPEEVVVHVARAATSGKGELQVRLNPAELGSVDVHLEFGDDNTLRVQIRADEGKAIDLLRRHGHELERTLQESGFELTRDAIRYEVGRDSGSEARQGQRDPRELNAAPTGPDHDAAVPTPAPPPPTLEAIRVLDLHA